MSVQKYERSEGFLANANLCSERSESQSHHRHQKRENPNRVLSFLTASLRLAYCPAAYIHTFPIDLIGCFEYTSLAKCRSAGKYMLFEEL